MFLNKSSNWINKSKKFANNNKSFNSTLTNNNNKNEHYYKKIGNNPSCSYTNVWYGLINENFTLDVLKSNSNNQYTKDK